MKNHLCSLLGLFVSNQKSPQLYRCSELPEDLLRHFSMAEIKAATNFNPDSILGTDANGSTIYKGTIDDGTIVAVKRCLRKGHQGGDIEEFQNEVKILCQLRHPYLISLIGFCEERNEMILVYEFMNNASLYHHLFCSYAPLSWKQRLQICIRAARGLHYLHTGAKYTVFHGDVQSRNILLDEDLSCKLDGFQLSKLGSFCMSKASRVRMESRILGTYGYMAPEYANYGELTEKYDVYAFGVILLEVLFGKQVHDSTLNMSILQWAEESLREGRIYGDIDPYLKGTISPQCLNKYLEISSSCVHYMGDERPGMGEVVVTLELALELQDTADSEIETINASGKCLYEEILFSAFVRNFTGLDYHKFSINANY